MDDNNEALKIKVESFSNTYNNKLNTITGVKVIIELGNTKKEGENDKKYKKDEIVQFSLDFSENFSVESDDNYSNKSKH